MTSPYDSLHKPAALVFVRDVQSKSHDFAVDVNFVSLANFCVADSFQSPVDKFRSVG
jgi:hypothetical protein